MADAVTAAAGSITDRMNGSRSRLASSEETFLSLLTVQLKNQDPLSPLDSNQFTQQIVQMTGVEQQLIANDLLAMLVGMSDGGLSSAVNLIGKTVSAETAKSVIADGEASWTYELPRNAASVKLEIVNAAGQVVWTQDKTNVAGGKHELAWDGKTANGDQLPDGGTYALKITAKGVGGESIAASSYISGVVSGVETVNGETLVTLGKSKVPLSAIVSVNQNAA